MSNELFFELDGVCLPFAAGDTIKAAAARHGILIDTLCGNGEYPDSAYCMVCAVYDAGAGRMVPACATLVAAMMKLEHASARVRAFRRRALALILSDHTGDCVAPCVRACPYHFDIPAVLAGKAASSRPDCAHCDSRCQKACRKNLLDHTPVAIKNFLTEHLDQTLPLAAKRETGFTHSLRLTKEYLPLIAQMPQLDNGCLQCRCLAQNDCRLRALAQKYELSHTGNLPQNDGDIQKIYARELIFDPGKCILCGRCVFADARRGLTFWGRGETLTVTAPAGEDIVDVLNQMDAAAVSRACPVGALKIR